MSFITEKIKRVFFISLGTIFLGIGSIGIILPILPTTPFLLLAAACYIRGSPRIYQWLISNRFLGEYISNYIKGKGIKQRQKLIAIFSMWLMISITIHFFLDNIFLKDWWRTELANPVWFLTLQYIDSPGISSGFFFLAKIFISVPIAVKHTVMTDRRIVRFSSGTIFGIKATKSITLFSL